jgi:ATP-independent RNA helicase DbpA
VGKITVTDFCTFVAVQRDLAGHALQALNNGKVKGRSVKARLM